MLTEKQKESFKQQLLEMKEEAEKELEEYKDDRLKNDYENDDTGRDFKRSRSPGELRN